MIYHSDFICCHNFTFMIWTSFYCLQKWKTKPCFFQTSGFITVFRSWLCHLCKHPRSCKQDLFCSWKRLSVHSTWTKCPQQFLLSCMLREQVIPSGFYSIIAGSPLCLFLVTLLRFFDCFHDRALKEFWKQNTAAWAKLFTKSLCVFIQLVFALSWGIRWGRWTGDVTKSFTLIVLFVDYL